ncbi:hypothetical protein LR066_02295 [candidate division WOR-3 bacterium]|nr:hypothetical protein [candidate division WOR-3 bacterium]
MRYVITIFISSLLLFLGLFYYWRRQSDFDEEIERVEIRVFFNGDSESIIASIKEAENVEGVDEVEMTETRKRLEGYIDKELNEFSLPSLLRVYPLNKGEDEMEYLAQKLIEINGVVDVFYGKIALRELWNDMKELRIGTVIVGGFFFLVFIFSVLLYAESTSVMRNWKTVGQPQGLSLHRKTLFWLRLRLLFNIIAVSGGSAIISIAIVYLSLLYTSPNTPFLPTNWMCYYLLGLISVGIFISICKRIRI